MITLIEQTLDIVNEMALTGDKKEDAYRILDYIKHILKWDFSKVDDAWIWIVEYLDLADLLDIISSTSNVSDKWFRIVLKQLVSQYPGGVVFTWISLFAPDDLASKCWKYFLMENPSKKDLQHVFTNASEPYATMAKEMLDRMEQ